jgi:hypothetical protein
MVASASACPGMRGKRGAGGLLLAVIPRGIAGQGIIVCIYRISPVNTRNLLARIGAVIQAARNMLPLAYSCIYDIQSLHLTCHTSGISASG